MTGCPVGAWSPVTVMAPTEPGPMANGSPPAGAELAAEVAEGLAEPHGGANWSIEGLGLLLATVQRLRLTPESLASLAAAQRSYADLQAALRRMDQAGEALARSLRAQL